MSVQDGVTIQVVTADELAADESFWQLYEMSFGTAEREPREIIVRSLRAGPGFALRARADGATVGLATAHTLTHAASTFLVYLAVHPQWRSRQLGSALFDAADSIGFARLADSGRKPAGIVWEIEDPDDPAQPEDSDLRRGRLRFFERLGGRLLPVPYIQPPVDGRTLVPMRLMFRPANDQDLPDRPTLAALVRAIFFDKYQAMNGIPRATLESLAAKFGAAEPHRA